MFRERAVKLRRNIASRVLRQLKYVCHSADQIKAGRSLRGEISTVRRAQVSDRTSIRFEGHLWQTSTRNKMQLRRSKRKAPHLLNSRCPKRTWKLFYTG